MSQEDKDFELLQRLNTLLPDERKHLKKLLESGCILDWQMKPRNSATKNHLNDKHYLQIAAQRTEASIPSNHAFIIVTAEVDKENSPARYVSDMKRTSAIALLKTLLFQWGEKENWMNHIH